MVVKLSSILFLALVSLAQAKPLLVTQGDLSALQGDAKSLLKKCETELAQPTHAVADLALQPHYNTKGANPVDDQAKGLTSDFRRAYRAALCFRLSGNAAYAKQAQMIADTWAGTMKSASTKQGVADINFNAAQLVVAASWVQKDWNDKTFRSWLKTVIAPMTRSDKPNNHGNWGNLLDVSIAAYFDDDRAMKTAAKRWRELVTSQIADDGTLPLEICRSNSSDYCDGPDKGVNGLAYTHYTLLPATLAGTIIAQAEAISFADPASSKKLNAAYATTLKFTHHPETFPYFASNQGKLNKVDYCAYFPLLRRALQIPPTAEACSTDIWLLQQLYAGH